MAGMVYQWRSEGPRFIVDAQVVGEEIERIGGHNSGEVTPQQLVNEARPETRSASA